MSEFFLCCHICQQVTVHPFYKQSEFGTIWNTHKNFEFLEEHGDESEKCEMSGIAFINNATRDCLIRSGYKIQK